MVRGCLVTVLKVLKVLRVLRVLGVLGVLGVRDVLTWQINGNQCIYLLFTNSNKGRTGKIIP
jgi:hypothetical protein